MPSAPDTQFDVPTGALRTRIDRRGAAVVVHVAGEVDLSSAAGLDQRLDEAERLVPQPVPVVLDLTDVTFLASVGLSLLIDHDRRCTQAGSALRVVAANRAVVRAIAVTGLTDTVTVVSTLAEALEETA